MPVQLRNLVVLLAALGVPLLAQYLADRFALSPYAQAVLFKIGMNVTLAVGLSLIIGFAGQFSIGHAGFMSLGSFFSAAFTSFVLLHWTAGMDPALLSGDGFGAAFVRGGLLLGSMFVGTLAAAVGSIIVGVPSLRLRGDYLAIATLGFGEIVYNLLLIYLQKNSGDTALYIDYRLEFMSRPVNIASAWILALLAILVVRNLVSSTTGRALPAIREDEIAASAVGVNTTRYKLLAFVLGSVLAGAAGALESHQTLTANPASYRFDRSIELIVPVVLGGSGSLTGCVLASAAFTYLLELLRDLPSGAQQYRTILYAGVLVLVMILRPQGLMGRWELGDLAAFLRRRGKPAGGRAAPPTPIRTTTPPDASAPGFLSGKGTAPPRLTCEALTIRFGGLTAVNKFSLCLDAGEIVGLIGPNGAGKTTCFNMITGVYRPSAGDIRLADRSLVGCNCAAINGRGIARTFQNIRLFGDLTVLDNVRIALHAHLTTGVPAAIFRTPRFYHEERLARQQAMHLLTLFDLAGLASEVASSLPYGAQRRLEIARALATAPRILCLDEPAAGMNPAEKRDLMSLIRRIRDQFGLTILLIEHDMRVVMGVCERILVLDYGETIAEGRPEDIRDNPRVVEAYLGKPLGAQPAAKALA
ncbi:MAG: branched-chain amino acid ABC transporter ATP-binding protein/permease [Planctomycetes bacterium]|nr:branched-chain amino acid ABC transporter ATP-binding protein/permease [Planctomycetota bacterium]